MCALYLLLFTSSSLFCPLANHALSVGSYVLFIPHYYYIIFHIFLPLLAVLQWPALACQAAFC